MKRKMYRKSTWFASAAGAFLAAGIVMGLLSAPDTVSGLILWTGTFFLVTFLGGFAGMQLSLQFSRKYQVTRPKGWLISAILSAVMLFGIGAGGQALFMYSREEVTVLGDVDMALLLDASSSMTTSNYTAPRTEAGCQFVDSLSESDQLVAISFASIVSSDDITALLPMDDSGKATISSFIRNIDSSGMTNFNSPLEKAIQILSTQGRADSSKAVILLTDGEAPLDRSVMDLYASSGVKVFSIRISTTSSLSSYAKDLADFAASTGGFDIQLTPDAQGNVSTADLVAAFRSAFQSTSEKRTTMVMEPLLYTESTSVWQFIIRTVTLIGCAVLFGFGYFGRFSLKTLLAHVGVGLAVSVLITLLGEFVADICLYMFFILIPPAYVTLNLNPGDDVYV